MEKEEQRIFQNGKELLAGCIEKLNQNQNREVGGNVALYPTVIVMLGEQSRGYTKYIKDTLEDNWNNSYFLEYISVIKEETGWKCSILAEIENKKMQWDTVEGSPNETICRAVVKMLQQDERVFQEKSSIKMEFILDSTEEEGQAYYHLYLEAQNYLQTANLKTLFFMLDQNPGEKKNRKTEELLQCIHLERKENSGTIYLLSNYLTSGTILGENKIWQNYRLAADIILLGGSKNSESRYVSKLYNGIKTAAYALVTKPTDEIAAVSLKTLLREMYNQEKQKYTKELSEQEIQERLGIMATQEFYVAEQIFQEKIAPFLPLPEHLLYLPFRSERELKELQKMEQISTKEADICTMGGWSAFVQKNYLCLIEQFWKSEKEVQIVREQIQNLCYQAFSIFEWEDIMQREEYLRQLLQKELCFEGVYTKASFTEKLHKSALYQCKREFYKTIKQIFVQEFEQILFQVKQYKKQYLECEKEVQQESLITGEENLSIKKLYTNEVKQYIEYRQTAHLGKTAFLEVFTIQQRKEEFLSAVWKVFLDLVHRELFYYDFEKELDFRMNRMAENHRQIYVATELQKTLSGSIRFRSLTDALRKTSCFYLIHGRANYAKQLANQDGNGRDFMLFYLNRSDCMEQIEIYDITKREVLDLIQKN